MSIPTNVRYLQRFENYQKALALLEIACENPPQSLLEKDGIIHRFEYTFELAWKTLQDIAAYRGYDGIVGPRPVIEQSFSDGLIQDGVLWFQMLRDRNETSHIYDEMVISRILQDIPEKYVHALVMLEAHISQYALSS